MNLVNRNKVIFPSLWNEIFAENRLDVPNYENFSTPPVNISENLSNFVIELAVPGFEKENFAIEIEKEVLKVSSKIAPEQKSTDTDENIQFTRKEFNYNNFNRHFTLPKKVDVDGIKASYNNGILSISLPKSEVKKDMKKMVEIS